MAFDLDVSLDVKEVTRYLNRVQRKQVPFATALALTRTAQDAQKATKTQLPRKLDRPKKFTVDSVTIEAAKKNNLQSAVLFKPIAARYLRQVLRGGRSKEKKPGHIVPYQAKLNVYGGIQGRKRKAPAWRAGQGVNTKQFVATIRGIHGVWEHAGGKRNPRLKLIAVFEETVTYERNKFPFRKIAENVARNRFKRNFNNALDQALRTAR